MGKLHIQIYVAGKLVHTVIAAQAETAMEATARVKQSIQVVAIREE